MWARRCGNEGEKITFIQSAATKRPLGRMAWPVGTCIQLLAEMIQKAETRVPKATRQVARKCRPGPTRFQPNSITPRKLDSRKNAVSTSNASRGPSTPAVARENTDQLVPNW